MIKKIIDLLNNKSLNNKSLNNDLLLENEILRSKVKELQERDIDLLIRERLSLIKPHELDGVFEDGDMIKFCFNLYKDPRFKRLLDYLIKEQVFETFQTLNRAGNDNLLIGYGLVEGVKSVETLVKKGCNLMPVDHVEDEGYDPNAVI